MIATTLPHAYVRLEKQQGIQLGVARNHCWPQCRLLGLRNLQSKVRVRPTPGRCRIPDVVCLR